MECSYHRGCSTFLMTCYIVRGIVFAFTELCIKHYSPFQSGQKALKWVEWKEAFCSIQIKILHIVCKIGSALSFSCYSWHAFVPRSMTFMNEPNFELCKRH
jgi:hypothetical protein